MSTTNAAYTRSVASNTDVALHDLKLNSPGTNVTVVVTAVPPTVPTNNRLPTLVIPAFHWKIHMPVVHVLSFNAPALPSSVAVTAAAVAQLSVLLHRVPSAFLSKNLNIKLVEEAI